MSRSTETDSKPFEVSENKRITTTIYSLAMFVAAVAVGYAAYTRLEDRAVDQEERIKKIETKLEDVAAIKRDIEWIRAILERQYGPKVDSRRP